MIGAPARASGVRRRVDWRRAAQLLGEGKTPAEVAGMLGCARQTIDRRLARDRQLTDAVARITASRNPEEVRLRKLRQSCQQAIENEVQEGNVRVILWLADRLKLIHPPDQRTPQNELDDLLSSMSADELKEFEALTDVT